VFTYFLVQGLDGAADADGDTVVTVGELYQFIDAQMQGFRFEGNLASKGAASSDLLLARIAVLQRKHHPFMQMSGSIDLPVTRSPGVKSGKMVGGRGGVQVSE
jgi:hypothetical protein